MFLVTSIATLRERTSGTLERLMTTPLSRAGLIGGYAVAFALMAVVQVAVTATVSLLLGMTVAGSIAWLLMITLVDSVLGLALGLFASAFARTEFQAVQMMPVFVLPPLLLCGLFQARSDMAAPLRWLSDVFPLSYAVDSLQLVARGAAIDASFVRDLIVVLASVVAGLVAAASSLRRRTS